MRHQLVHSAEEAPPPLRAPPSPPPAPESPEATAAEAVAAAAGTETAAGADGRLVVVPLLVADDEAAVVAVVPPHVYPAADMSIGVEPTGPAATTPPLLPPPPDDVAPRIECRGVSGCAAAAATAAAGVAGNTPVSSSSSSSSSAAAVAAPLSTFAEPASPRKCRTNGKDNNGSTAAASSTTESHHQAQQPLFAPASSRDSSEPRREKIGNAAVSFPDASDVLSAATPAAASDGKKDGGANNCSGSEELISYPRASMESSTRSLGASSDRWLEDFDADTSGSDEEDSDEDGDDIDSSSSSSSGSSTANNAALSPAATTFNIPRLRDPLGIKPPMRKPEMEEDGDLSPARVDQVWGSLVPRHQCFIDRWPPDEIAAGGTAEGGREQGAGPSLEARLLIEEWLRCSKGSPRVCAERLRRLADARASWKWPEACFLARDVADVLLTGAMKLLPGSSRGGSAPRSPPILVVHTRLVDHERCPPAQYTKGLSYLVQTLAEERRANGGGGGAGAGRRSRRRASCDSSASGFFFGDSEESEGDYGGDIRHDRSGTGGGSPVPVGGTGPCSSDLERGQAEVILVIDAHKDTVGAKVKKIISLFIGGGGDNDDGSGGGAKAGRGTSRDSLKKGAVGWLGQGGANGKGGVRRDDDDEAGGGGGDGEAANGGDGGGGGVVGWDGTALGGTAGRGGGQPRLPLCDPALSMRPVRVRKVLVVNAGPVLKALLLPRRVSLSGALSPQWGPTDSSVGGGGGGGRGNGLMGGKVTARRGSISPPRRASSAASKSFLAVSGAVSRDWLRHEVGEEAAACLPVELGGDLDLAAWSWEGWVGRRIKREDLAESNMNLAEVDSEFAPATWRYLDACHRMAEATGTQDYAHVLVEALEGGLTVPVAWVKRTLGDMVQARQAHEPPWRGAYSGDGAKASTRSATSKGLNQEWAQLWKDMGRDIVEIRGERIDVSASSAATATLAGEGGGTAGAAGGNPEVVLAPLAKEISRAGTEGGIVGLTEVQCFLAARDILLSTKRTSSGGDVWVCVDRLCGMSRELVVVCPASNEADPLHISAEFEIDNSSDSFGLSLRKQREGGAAAAAAAPPPPPPFALSSLPPLLSPGAAVTPTTAMATGTAGGTGSGSKAGDVLPPPPPSSAPSSGDGGDGGASAAVAASGFTLPLPLPQQQQHQPFSPLSATWNGTGSGRWSPAEINSVLGIIPVEDHVMEAGGAANERTALGQQMPPARKPGRLSMPATTPRATSCLPACSEDTIYPSRRKSDPAPAPPPLPSPPRRGVVVVAGKPATETTAEVKDKAEGGQGGGSTTSRAGTDGGVGTARAGDEYAAKLASAIRKFATTTTSTSSGSKISTGGGASSSSSRSSSSASARPPPLPPRPALPPPLPPRPGAGSVGEPTAAGAYTPAAAAAAVAAATPVAGEAEKENNKPRPPVHRDNGTGQADRRSSEGSYNWRPRSPQREAAAAVAATYGGDCGAGVRLSVFASTSAVPLSTRGGVGAAAGAAGAGAGEGGKDSRDRACVRVTVTTEMSYKICDANPSSEDDAVIAVVTGVFKRVFRVRVSGAVQGVQPTDENPIVGIKLER